MKLDSKRNYVEKLDIGGRSFVRKHFYSIDGWRAELTNHALIRESMPVANIETAVPGVILSEYLPYPNLLDVLNDQENNGFRAQVWERFASWLKRAEESGMLPSEGNLRNFLWNEACAEIVPVDLEHWKKISFDNCAAGIIAFLMEYEPADSEIKRAASKILMNAWGMDEAHVMNERRALKERRENKQQNKKEVSVVILAGGKSARMGSSKAQLDLLGKTLLEHQAETAYMLGAGEVLLSGSPEITGRSDSIKDELPGRGPLGGIYSCLKRAKYQKCLVLGTDMPFVSAGMLSKLVEEYEKGGCEVAAAVHNGRIEPMAAIYATKLVGKIGDMISVGGAPVRSLLQNVNVRCVGFTNEALWCNCNTPGEYTIILKGHLTQTVLKNI